MQREIYNALLKINHCIWTHFYACFTFDILSATEKIVQWMNEIKTGEKSERERKNLAREKLW